MFKTSSYLLSCLFILLVSALHPLQAFAQSSSTESSVEDSASTLSNSNPTELINSIALRIEEKQQQRLDLQQLIRAQEGAPSTEEISELEDLNADIERLEKNLVLALAGQPTLNAIYDTAGKETTWQEDVVDILKPLADSLKNVTSKPRKIAELRDNLEAVERRQSGFESALNTVNSFNSDGINAQAKRYLDELKSTWEEELNQTGEERLLISRQLQDLTGQDSSFAKNLWPNVKSFFTGPGLTIVLAVVAALATYFVLRALWWFYSRKIASKEVRRRSSLYRFFSYSFHFLTAVLVVLAALLVIYVREDLLLLALSFMLIAGILLNIKQFFPQYITEARLLLNMGSVREDERVVYNGLPWQVKSINIYSVLHNPALDGVARVPLAEMENLVSRPVKNNLWFPSKKGDYVILPDGTFGLIKVQTPDLVEVTVRGGMAQTFPTSDFYNLNVVNLTRDESFGVSTTFGLDYSLQSIAVKEIPATLKAAIEKTLHERGYEKKLKSIIVELSAASASSLDFLVFTTFDKSVASDYFKLERLLLQTCIEVSNEKNWTIPFPQLTIHQETHTNKLLES